MHHGPQLANTTANCKIVGKQVVFPYCDLITGGIACQTESKANNHRIKNPVQKGEGKTGETYADCKKAAEVHKPKFMLLQKGEGFDKSDAEFIESDLGTIGYWVHAFEIWAEDYSSKTVRGRSYYACVLEEVRSKKRARYMENTLRILK